MVTLVQESGAYVGRAAGDVFIKGFQAHKLPTTKMNDPVSLKNFILTCRYNWVWAICLVIKSKWSSRTLCVNFGRPWWWLAIEIRRYNVLLCHWRHKLIKGFPWQHLPNRSRNWGSSWVLLDWTAVWLLALKLLPHLLITQNGTVFIFKWRQHRVIAPEGHIPWNAFVIPELISRISEDSPLDKVLLGLLDDIVDHNSMNKNGIRQNVGLKLKVLIWHYSIQHTLCSYWIWFGDFLWSQKNVETELLLMSTCTICMLQ